jgi:hypothetical protein
MNIGEAAETTAMTNIKIKKKANVSKVANSTKSHSLTVKVSPLEVLPFKIFLGIKFISFLF